jgi:hypothetical protein
VHILCNITLSYHYGADRLPEPLCPTSIKLDYVRDFCVTAPFTIDLNGGGALSCQMEPARDQIEFDRLLRQLPPNASLKKQCEHFGISYAQSTQI